MTIRRWSVLAASFVLTSGELAFAQVPPPAQPAPAQPAPAQPAPAEAPEGTVTVTPPPAPGEVPPPTGPTEPITPPVPLVPQPAPPPSEKPPEAAAADLAAAPAEDKDGVAGWYPGFYIKSDDDKFKLRVGLQAMYRFEPHWLDGDPQNRSFFYVLRPIIAGNLFEEWIRFWTSIELASNPPFVVDSYMEIQPRPEVALRIGQQYTPLSRHEYLGPQEILFPDWSPVAEYFWTGRDKGITLYGTLGESIVDYWLGVYSGSPLRQVKVIDGNYVLEARATVSPMGTVAANEFIYITQEEVPFGISFTVQGMHGNVETAVENFNPSSFRFDVAESGERRKQSLGAADIWVQGGPMTAFVEGYVRRTDPQATTDDAYTSMGAWGQIGLMVLPRLMDIGARVNVLDASDELENDIVTTFEGQVAYYPFHTLNLVVKARYAFADQSDPGVEGAPLYFAPGVHHAGTLQLGLAL